MKICKIGYSSGIVDSVPSLVFQRTLDFGHTIAKLLDIGNGEYGWEDCCHTARKNTARIQRLLLYFSHTAFRAPIQLPPYFFFVVGLAEKKWDDTSLVTMSWLNNVLCDRAKLAKIRRVLHIAKIEFLRPTKCCIETGTTITSTDYNKMFLVK